MKRPAANSIWARATANMTRNLAWAALGLALAQPAFAQAPIDWSEAQTGPGILDLMAFIEGYPLLQERRDGWEQAEPRLRHAISHTEETIIDTYLLTLSAELSGRSSARAFRATLPAARCLHILLTWFPYFATWADDMPDRYVWQRVNRRSETEVGRYYDAPPVGMRRYLAGVFERFLRACHSL